eukprot:2661359-Rhodomonas_salina.2
MSGIDLGPLCGTMCGVDIEARCCQDFVGSNDLVGEAKVASYVVATRCPVPRLDILVPGFSR